MARFEGYNNFHGSGWRRYGRLIINFHQYQITSIWFNGAKIF